MCNILVKRELVFGQTYENLKLTNVNSVKWIVEIIAIKLNKNINAKEDKKRTLYITIAEIRDDDKDISAHIQWDFTLSLFYSTPKFCKKIVSRETKLKLAYKYIENNPITLFEILCGRQLLFYTLLYKTLMEVALSNRMFWTEIYGIFLCFTSDKESTTAYI